MLSKNKIKLIQSLQQKKQRELNSLFVVEGNKIVRDILSSNYLVKTLIATEKWLASAVLKNSEIEVICAEPHEIEKISSFSSPQEVVAVVEMPTSTELKADTIHDLTLVLEDIQDPGNMGTILRIADWFGIKNIICSQNTVDVYNSKVVQASMGSICRVNVFYTELIEFLGQFKFKNINIYGTFLEGESIYEANLEQIAFIVMGNESKGITNDISKLIKRKIKIPSFPANTKEIDSLNVSIATGIICSEFRRRVINSTRK